MAFIALSPWVGNLIGLFRFGIYIIAELDVGQSHLLNQQAEITQA